MDITDPETVENLHIGSNEQQQRYEEDDSDEQLSVVTLLQRLIQNGQVRVVDSSTSFMDAIPALSSDSDTNSTPISGNSSPARKLGRIAKRTASKYVEADSEEFKRSDFFNEISLRRGKDRPTIIGMLMKREMGRSVPQRTEFTHENKCRILNRFIPNKRQSVERVKTKTFCCHYTDDGHTLITASQDPLIRIYEKQGKRHFYTVKKTIRAPKIGWSILDLDISPDGQHAIYSTWSEFVHQCSIHGDDPEWRAFYLNPPDFRFAVFSLRFSADGSEVLAGASDHRLYIFGRQAQRLTLHIEAHDDDVNAACFGDEASNIIYSGADDGLCKATRCAVSKQTWDYRWQSVPRHARRSRRLQGDSSLMTYTGEHTVLHTLVRARFSPEFTTGQRFVYSGCARGHCVVYDTLTGRLVKKFEGHMSVVRDCAWHPTEMEMATCSWDGETAVWKWDERNDDKNDEEYFPSGAFSRQRRNPGDGGRIYKCPFQLQHSNTEPNRSRSRRGRWSASLAAALSNSSEDE